MSLSVNIASLNIYNEQNKNFKIQRIALDRISSGSKLSTSSDDSTAIAQSEKLNMQIRGKQMTQRNAQDGVSMLQTTEGGLDTATSMLQRIRELVIQAGGATDSDDKSIIQSEIGQLVSGINDAVNNNEFNGVNLVNDKAIPPTSLIMAVGSNSGEVIQIPKYNLTSSNLKDATGTYSLNDIDVTQTGGIDKALSIIDNSLGTVINARSNYGAIENRLNSTYDNAGAIEENMQEAQSSISDADLPQEMMEYSRTGILIEAGNALMAQTNKFPQEILQILQNVK